MDVSRVFSFAGLLLAFSVSVNTLASTSGDDIIKRHENRGGLAVVVGDGNEDLVLPVARQAHYALHVLLQDEPSVTALRRKLRDTSLYGKASVEKWRGGRLPYIDNLVNLLVCDTAQAVDHNEILRVLVPNGLALLRKENGWEELRKPKNPKTDDWPQYLYEPGNNPVSKDEAVAPPRHLQWRGSPQYGRFHEKMSSFAAMVSSGGRVFHIIDEGPAASIYLPANWQLTARDAYNGTVLWKKPIKNWVWRFFPYKAGPVTVPRRLVTTEDSVWVTLGITAPVVKLDAKNGNLLKTYDGTDYADELLLSHGTLFVVVRNDINYPDTLSNGEITRARRASRDYWVKNRADRLLAMDPNSGRILWEKKLPLAALTLATDEKQVYLCDYDKVQAFDHATGKHSWSSASLPIAESYQSGMSPRLVVSDGVVLFIGSKVVDAGGKAGSWAAGPDVLTALSAETGKTMWETAHSASGFLSPEDIFVIKGTVWFGATRDGKGKGIFTGVNLRTGKVETTFEPDEKSYWFHQRCYPQKATEKYIIASRTGVEYVDLEAQHWELNHWVRGGCTYGVMPANGLTYAGQHPCACYPETKLTGLNAMAPARAKPAPSVKDSDRLVKGPEYSSPLGACADKDDWPLLRCDTFRSSCAPVALSGKPAHAWSVKAGANLSAPVVAGGKLFAADKDTHTVFALDAKTGKQTWEFTAGGRVDSPPAYARGQIVFGSADGHVYCLNAADGTLRWRFLAADRNERMFNFEQLESVWPVSGCVLPIGKTVCFTAGRNVFLDGGILFWKLDLATGKILSRDRWTGKDPSGKDYHHLVSSMAHEGLPRALSGIGLTMPPANNDILSANDKYIFMSSQVLTLDGKRIMNPPVARNNNDDQSHIFTPVGMLDGSYWHRGYAAFGNGVEGGYSWTYSLNRLLTGKILCADAENVYSFGRAAGFNKWTLPLEFHLYSAAKGMNEPIGPDSVKKKKRGPKTKPDWRWSVQVPIWARAMFVTDKAVYTAGNRDLYNETRLSNTPAEAKQFKLQQEHWEGRHGSLLIAVDKNTGKTLHTVELPVLPTWDGMVAADGKIFMTTTDGGVSCYGMTQ
jgi:outer membrane protein assembly factor BamB